MACARILVLLHSTEAPRGCDSSEIGGELSQKLRCPAGTGTEREPCPNNPRSFRVIEIPADPMADSLLLPCHASSACIALCDFAI